MPQGAFELERILVVTHLRGDLEPDCAQEGLGEGGWRLTAHVAGLGRQIPVTGYEGDDRSLGAGFKSEGRPWPTGVLCTLPCAAIDIERGRQSPAS